jgi:hypothetical protein
MPTRMQSPPFDCRTDHSPRGLDRQGGLAGGDLTLRRRRAYRSARAPDRMLREWRQKSMLARSALTGFLFAALCLPAAAQAPPIKLGEFLDMTGGGATAAESAKLGVDIAVAQINVTGGIGGRHISSRAVMRFTLKFITPLERRWPESRNAVLTG